LQQILKISKEYDLDIDKTLWIEIDDKIRVTILDPGQKVVPEIPGDLFVPMN